MISSITAAMPGTLSSISPGRSCPSHAAIGRTWVIQCEDWYKCFSALLCRAKSPDARPGLRAVEGCPDVGQTEPSVEILQRRDVRYSYLRLSRRLIISTPRTFPPSWPTLSATGATCFH